MNGKIAGLGAVVFLGAIVYARHAGVQSTEERLGRQYADSVAARSTRVADSVKAFYVRQFDAAQRSTDSVKRAAEARVNSAARQTNAALENGKSAVESATRLLNDSSATLAELRGALETDNHAIDSLTATITTERNATTEARQASDSAHAKEIRLLREGFRVTTSAQDSALVAFRRAMVADIAKARGAGLRKGRIEGGLVGVGLVAALVYLVKP